jgi:hypothetical protein
MTVVPPAARRTIDYSDDPAYWLALGQFVSRFAGVENAMRTFLAMQANVSDPVARAVFSGVHPEQAIQFIERIWNVCDPGREARAELRCAFRQLSAINARRNLILHFGSYETTDRGRVASTALRATRASGAEELSASIATLGAMSADLDKIGLHLASHMAYPNSPLSDRLSHFPALAEAWRYTPHTQRQNPKAGHRPQRKPKYRG